MGQIFFKSLRGTIISSSRITIIIIIDSEDVYIARATIPSGYVMAVQTMIKEEQVNIVFVKYCFLTF